MDHYVNLSDIQQTIGQYVDRYNLVVAGGPFAAAGFVRTFIKKNRIVSIALAGSAAWFVVKELSGPMQYQFKYLQQLVGFK